MSPNKSKSSFDSGQEEGFIDLYDFSDNKLPDGEKVQTTLDVRSQQPQYQSPVGKDFLPERSKERDQSKNIEKTQTKKMGLKQLTKLIKVLLKKNLEQDPSQALKKFSTQNNQKKVHLTYKDIADKILQQLTNEKPTGLQETPMRNMISYKVRFAQKQNSAFSFSLDSEKHQETCV